MVLLSSPQASARLPLSPGMPSMNAIPLGGASEATPDRAGAVPKLFFSIERSIDTLAKAVPQVASRLDEVKMSLRGIMAEALEGAGGISPETEPDQTSFEGSPY